MGILVSLRLFKPMFKNASKMTAPVQELKIAGGGVGDAGIAIGDIAEFTARGKATELDSVSKKLFSSFDEFKESALKRLGEYHGNIPEKILADVEKSVTNNEFELTKVIRGYYARLNECKTLEEVAVIYPEFAHLNIDMANELRTMIKSSIPESVCKEAIRCSTKEEGLQHIIKYMEQATNKCVKEWQSYPDILRIQRETAVEIVNGTFTGSKDATAGLKFFANKEPLRFYLLDKKDRDAVVLSYLKQYYSEGKSLPNMVPEVARGRAIRPENLNYRGYRWSDPTYQNFRIVATTIEKEANEFKALSQMSKGEISSAIMKRTWKKSALRSDLASETRFGKGWTNIKNILLKRKGVENHISASDRMINRYLLNRFKTNNRNVTETNPFLSFENPEKDKTATIKRFINSLYHVNETTLSEKTILKSEEFKKFKSQFDIEGMKASIQKIEDLYVNIFFKSFWTDMRKERFTTALREATGSAQENIKVSDSILMQAMSEALV